MIYHHNSFKFEKDGEVSGVSCEVLNNVYFLSLHTNVKAKLVNNYSGSFRVPK